MTPTDANTIGALIEEGYSRLAERLEQMPAHRWDEDSLCEGWRIREVVAHMTMPVRYSEEEFMAELRDCDFDFTRLSDQVAERDSSLPAGQLLAELRSEELHRWTPPGGGTEGALNHLVIHGLDITVPLGDPPCSSEEAVRFVLDQLTRGGGHAHFGTDLGGSTYEATDIDWRFGSGPLVRATATDLLLRFCGRRPAGT